MKNNIRYLLFFCMLLSIPLCAKAQHSPIKRVAPLNWWVGMKEPHLQLMMEAPNLTDATVSIDYPGVHLQKVHHPSNNDFLFLDLKIDASTSPGQVPIHFKRDNGSSFTYRYELKSRRNDHQPDSISTADAIYLITPDRFANGDSSNDSVAGLRDSLNRKDPNGRHGGDIQGIIDHLDYLQNLGITTLWINPLLTNAMPKYSYHGYAITDFYHVDPRFGNNEQYQKLAQKLHKRGMKLIMDMVFNHSGRGHWWVDNPPDSNWVHPYRKSNFAMSSVSDPHATEAERKSLQSGWFVPSMPDLNESNPYLANYLIQNSLWWIEYAGLDGIRMDTYPFNNQPFMKRWVQRVEKEYPGFYIVGENWYTDVAEESYWAGKDTTQKPDFNTQLPSITDFPLTFAARKAFKNDGSVQALYNVLKKDFLYDQPSTNLIFLDNHDMDRFYYAIEQHWAKYKLAMTFLLTTRGIPEIYYGTELLMATHGKDGVIRKDMPGGWNGDRRSAFTKKGRTQKENKAYAFTRKLLQWRKSSKAIASGDLTHLPPKDKVYAYVRRSNTHAVLVILNDTDKSRKINLEDYQELTGLFRSAKDIISGQTYRPGENIQLAGNQPMILELKK